MRYARTLSRHRVRFLSRWQLSNGRIKISSYAERTRIAGPFIVPTSRRRFPCFLSSSPGRAGKREGLKKPENSSGVDISPVSRWTLLHEALFVRPRPSENSRRDAQPAFPARKNIPPEIRLGIFVAVCDPRSRLHNCPRTNLLVGKNFASRFFSRHALWISMFNVIASRAHLSVLLLGRPGIFLVARQVL